MTFVRSPRLPVSLPISNTIAVPRPTTGSISPERGILRARTGFSCACTGTTPRAAAPRPAPSFRTSRRVMQVMSNASLFQERVGGRCIDGRIDGDGALLVQPSERQGEHEPGRADGHGDERDRA